MAKSEKKFEEKMKDLENIINELENGNIDLEDSINKYTEAMKLVHACDEQLKSIEKQVSKIVTEDGTLKEFNMED